MRELDLLLVPFVNEVFDTLNYQEQLLYSEFLKEEDQDLFAWLMGRAEPPKSKYNPIIVKILANKQQSN